MRKCIPVLFVVFHALGAVAGTYVESFDTTLFKDALATTAVWDTTAGSLHLPTQHMEYLGGVGTSGGHRLAVMGGTIALARGAGGVDLVDISDPVYPIVRSSMTDSGFPPRYVTDIAMSGTVLYLGWSRTVSFFPPVTHHGISIYSIANPDAPVFVQTLSSGPISSMTVHGNRLYSTSGAALLVWDITDPVLPTSIGSIALPGTIQEVAVSGQMAYVAAGSFGLHVVDLNAETAPVLRATLALPGTTVDVTVNGSLVCAAAQSAGALMVDVANPDYPQLIGAYAAAGAVTRVAVDGDILALGGALGGVTQLDITDPTVPFVVDQLSSPLAINDLALSGDRLFTVTDNSLGIARAAAGSPLIRERDASIVVPVYGSFAGIQAEGDRLYVAANGLVHVFDNTRMVPFGEIGTGFGNFGVGAFDVDGSLCHTAEGGYRTIVKLRDVSDPFLPVTMGLVIVSPTLSPLAIDADGRLDFVLMRRSLQAPQVAAVDVSILSAPVVVGSVTLPPPPGSKGGGHFDVLRSGSSLLVLDDTAGVEIYSVNDPTNMTLVGHYDGMGGRYIEAIAVQGNLMYVVASDSAVVAMPSFEVVDLAQPASPVLLGWCTLGLHDSGVHNLAVSGSRVSFSGNYGLHTVDVANPTAPWVVHTLEPGLHQLFRGFIDVAGDYAYVDRLTAIRGYASRDTIIEYRIFNRGVNPVANVGSSLEVAVAASPVAIRLIPTVSGESDWKYSLDGGLNFGRSQANGSWESVYPLHGSSLTWQVVLHMSPGAPPPVCSGLEIDWRPESPTIVSLRDVSADQGGLLSLTFESSGMELANGFWGLTYTVYRRSSTGNWDSVAVVPSVQGMESHTLLVPTVRDSTFWTGSHQSVYRIRAGGYSGSAFVDSPPDSAVSIDNLPPSPVTAASIAYGATPHNLLHWTASSDADVMMYRLHRGFSVGFAVSMATVVDSTTADSVSFGWEDYAYGDHSVYYAVTAVDTAGNVSLPLYPGVASGVPAAGLPTRWILGENSPNPFNPSTVITYAAPARGGVAAIVVYDLAGHMVRTLLSQSVAPGWHQVTWDGTDRHGWPVASGVYFCRLQTTQGVLTRKLVLVE